MTKWLPFLSVFLILPLQAPKARADDPFVSALGGIVSSAAVSASHAASAIVTALQNPNALGPTADPSTVEAGGIAFRLSSDTTSDSSVTLYGKLTSDVRSLLVTIGRADGKQDPADQMLLPADQTDWSARAYLKKGPGDYIIRVYDCTKSRDKCVHLQALQVTNADTRDTSFLLPSLDVESDSPELIELAHRLTDGLPSDLEKSRAIHHWITTTIAYDTAAFFDKSYLTLPWDALTVLHRKLAICQGYSTLNAALHRAIGIRAKVISGIADPIFTGAPSTDAQKLACKKDLDHAWNEIQIGGQWLPQDSTWDAGFVDTASRRFRFSPRETYFNPPEAEFDKSHLKCAESAS